MSTARFARILREYYPRLKRVRLHGGAGHRVPASLSAPSLPPEVATEIGFSRRGPAVRGGCGLRGLPEGIARPDIAALPEEGYVIRWGRGPVVWGRDYAGFYYGCATLSQLLREARRQGLRRIPAFAIADYPDLRRRGVMLDFGRGLSFHLEWVKQFIRRLASFKVNEFHFYFESRLEMTSLPLFAPPRSATQAQIRELIAWARGHAVTIVPMANLLAHNEELLRLERYAPLREERDVEEAYMFCPRHPATRPLLRREIAELCRLFDSPFVHVGLDEPVMAGACPRCGPLIARRGARELCADHLRFLHREITARGRRAALWCDILLPPAGESAGRRPYTAPRDLVVFDASYTGSRPESLRFFKRRGHDVYAVTTTGGWMHLFDDYEVSTRRALAFLKDAHAEGVPGSTICLWEVFYGARAEYLLPMVSHYAAAMWDRRPVRSREFLEFFGATRLGVDGRRFARFVFALSEVTARRLNAIARQVPFPACPDASRSWRYEVYAASDPLYSWKRLKREAGLALRVARFCEVQGERLAREWLALRRSAGAGRDIVGALEPVFLCLRTAALRLRMGERLRRAYRRMDRRPVHRRAADLKEALAALDAIGADLARHQASERRFIRRTGGDYHALECMADVQRRLTGWKADIRRAARNPRMPSLDLLLSLRTYRDPYPTTVRRFDTNMTLTSDANATPRPPAREAARGDRFSPG